MYYCMLHAYIVNMLAEHLAFFPFSENGQLKKNVKHPPDIGDIDTLSCSQQYNHLTWDSMLSCGLSSAR